LCSFSFVLNAASSGFSANPAALSFSWLQGAALPAAQSVAISGAAATDFVVSVAGGPWLTVTPLAGTTPGTLKVLANPSTLPVGSYSSTITVTPSGTLTAVQIPVALTVTGAASALTISPSSLDVTYQVGTPAPSGLTLSLLSGEGMLSFTATASGGAWLSVSPPSGVIFLAFPAEVNVSINPANLAPGTYKATIAIASTTASTKAQSVAVNLTVTPATPVITSIWPNQVPVGTSDTTITIGGTGFYSGSTVKANGIALKSTLLGATAVNAVVPAASLSTAGDLPIVVSNPPPGGGDSQPGTLTVLTAGPHLSTAGIVNAASYVGGGVSPGELVAIFGSGLGPDPLATFTPPADGDPLANSLGGVQVLFDSTPAPLLYVSANQIGAVVPYEVAGETTTQVQVQFNGASSETVAMDVVAADPAFFTLGSVGTGQCAALNYNATTQVYTINSNSNPAAAGSTVVLYATGEGTTNPVGADGQVNSDQTTLPQPVLPVTVQIGGVSATVTSATEAGGLVSGVLQVNVQVPTGLTAGKAVPVVLQVGTFTSPAGATISTK
jgi:uncharacterized protein (TIGR03437 family)